MLAALSLLRLLAPAAAGDDIRDLRGPIALAASAPLWPYLLAAAIALAAAAVVGAVRRRRRQPVPPHRRALRDLAAARTLAGDDPDRFSVVVSNILRDYLEEAFAFHAPRRTTEEVFVDLLNDDSPVAAHRDELRSFLEQCDLAKYARWSPGREAMTRMVDRAEVFVRATAPGGPS